LTVEGCSPRQRDQQAFQALGQALQISSECYLAHQE